MHTITIQIRSKVRLLRTRTCILRLRRKHGEKRRIARHAHDEVAVVFGMFLRVEQRFARHDVILHMKSVQRVEKGTQ